MDMVSESHTIMVRAGWCSSAKLSVCFLTKEHKDK